MPHTLIIGLPQMGKSHAAKKIAEELLRQGRTVLVGDTTQDPWPVGCKVWRDHDAFLDVARKSKRCALFVDEGGEIDMHSKNKKAFRWLSSASHHAPWGHAVYIMAQRAAMLDKSLRQNCVKGLIFRQGEDDVKVLAAQFGVKRDVMMQITEFGPGDHLLCLPGKPAIRQRFPA